jgi:hypothetical protein
LYVAAGGINHAFSCILNILLASLLYFTPIFSALASIIRMLENMHHNSQSFDLTESDKKRTLFGWLFASILSIYILISLVCTVIWFIQQTYMPVTESVTFSNIVDTLYILLYYSANSFTSLGLPVPLFVIIYIITIITELIYISKHPKSSRAFLIVAIFIFAVFTFAGGLGHAIYSVFSIALLTVIYCTPFFAIITSIVRITENTVHNSKINLRINRDMKNISSELSVLSGEQSKLQEKLNYLLKTMIGDEIESFESEAESVGFMVGWGKELIKKYSEI